VIALSDAGRARVTVVTPPALSIRMFSMSAPMQRRFRRGKPGQGRSSQLSLSSGGHMPAIIDKGNRLRLSHHKLQELAA
jgi:hypothetical protein